MSVFVCLVGIQAAGDQSALKIAVATNFKPALQSLVLAFEETTAHPTTIVSASTGSLVAQIIHGAPYDVFLSADQVHVDRLTERGHTILESRFTYAVGTLSLVSNSPIPGDSTLRLVLEGHVAGRVSIANPRLAPYGRAARQVLAGLGLLDALDERMVLGQNVGQALAMVKTGNAHLGIVATSLVKTDSSLSELSIRPIDSTLHDPILQDGVILKHTRKNQTAHTFWDFLKSDQAKQIIGSFGYRTL